MAAKREGPDLEKLKALLSVAMDLQEKLDATLGELSTQLGGGEALGDVLKRLYRVYGAAWAERYRGGRYVWAYQKDAPNLKRLLKMLGEEELSARMVRYIATDDPFIVRARHPFGLFVTGVNSYAGQAAPFTLEEDGPVADCRHSPKCRTDAEHTTRRRADLHA